MEKITFCIPSKSNLRYLKTCIPSIRKNAYRNDHDIIIFVDSDEDGTIDWLKEVKKKSPKTFLEVGVFHGVTARNICELLYQIHKDDFKYIGLDLFDDIETIAQELSVDEPTLSSGWEWLDEHLAGGFLENGRSFYVFAGQTNVGKSIFLGNIACNIASQGKTVLVISLEMSEMIYARRLSSNITRIPMKELKSASQSLSEQIKSYNNGKPDSKILIKEFPPSTITPQNIQGYITEIKNRGIKVDAVVLDYLNLLKSPYGDNSYERVKHVAEGIRALSYVFECPFISATQLNRSGYDEENPGLDTISESIGMAATADCIFSIFQDDEDKELGIVKMGMMKNRYGSNYGFTALRLNYDTLTISEDETLNIDDDGSEMADLTNTLNMLSN